LASLLRRHNVTLSPRMPRKLNDRGTVVSRHSGTDSVLSSSWSSSDESVQLTYAECSQLPKIQKEVADPKVHSAPPACPYRALCPRSRNRNLLTKAPCLDAASRIEFCIPNKIVSNVGKHETNFEFSSSRCDIRTQRNRGSKRSTVFCIFTFHF
jgi:hypothetical protein